MTLSARLFGVRETFEQQHVCVYLVQNVSRAKVRVPREDRGQHWQLPRRHLPGQAPASRHQPEQRSPRRACSRATSACFGVACRPAEAHLSRERLGRLNPPHWYAIPVFSPTLQPLAIRPTSGASSRTPPGLRRGRHSWREPTTSYPRSDERTQRPRHACGTASVSDAVATESEPDSNSSAHDPSDKVTERTRDDGHCVRGSYRTSLACCTLDGCWRGPLSLQCTTGAETSSSRLGWRVISIRRLRASVGRVVARHRIELAVPGRRKGLRVDSTTRRFTTSTARAVESSQFPRGNASFGSAGCRGSPATWKDRPVTVFRTPATWSIAVFPAA